MRWLRSLREKGEHPPSGAAPVLDLLVLEGEDAGRRFTVDQDRVEVGRGEPQSGRGDAIRLTDSTVSSQQALIHATPHGRLLEHVPDARNPTLVNGREVRSQIIEPGDRIGMGRILLEVRAHAGMSLSGLLHAVAEPGEGAAGTRERGGDATEQRPLLSLGGCLAVVGGAEDLKGRRFALRPLRTRVGRGLDCDVALPDRGVSRHHADLVWKEGELWIEHRSQVNPTLVNGAAVEESRRLAHGDEIQLADLVVLRVELGDAPAAPRAEATEASRRINLRQRMEEALRREREIEQEFGVVGSFLDVDVVGSSLMKADMDRAAHLIVSFERFRSFVANVIEEFGGMVLNSNGDELMCFFESTLEAVRAGSALLRRLDDFNERENLLPTPFRVRVGIDTGSSLVDKQRGVAYSQVLDTAGHLQKQADVNGLLISESTLQALPAGLPFEPAGTLAKEGTGTYRLVGWLE